MSEDKFESIVERDGEFHLQIDEDLSLPLIQVFEHYEVRGLDADYVAGTLGVEDSEVRLAVSYIHDNDDLYAELTDRVDNFSADERIFGVAEAERNREGYREHPDREVYEENIPEAGEV